jgi:predicted DNA-binding protein YlxM (UPF0122 family)
MLFLSHINPRITSEQKDQIITDYLAGQTQKQLAETYGVSHPTIGRIIKKAGIIIRLTPKQKKEMCAQYQQGSSSKELATKYGVTSRTITRILGECNVPARPPRYKGKLTAKQKTAICIDYTTGLSQLKIAQKYNIARSSIARIVKECGIITRLTPKQRKEICAQYQQGISTKELADDYGVTSRTITRILKEHDVMAKPPRYTGKLSIQQQKQISSQHRKGASIEGLAAQYEVSPTTIKRIIKRYRDVQSNPSRPLLSLVLLGTGIALFVHYWKKLQ